MIRKEVIHGCEGRGNGTEPYMTRYILLQLFGWRLCLHVFHRSDDRVLHDHPWPFWTFILRHGYIEHREGGSRRIRPLSLNYRPAEWKHCVEMIGGRNAVTLVLMGPRSRQWGFWVDGEWVNWRVYSRIMGCFKEEM